MRRSLVLLELLAPAALVALLLDCALAPAPAWSDLVAVGLAAMGCGVVLVASGLLRGAIPDGSEGEGDDRED